MKLESWIFKTDSEVGLKLVETLSWETNPPNFVGLCWEDWVFFVRDSVDRTKTVDWACDNTWLTIQAVVKELSDRVTILCTSFRNNWECKVISADNPTCPFYRDKILTIVNPVKWID